DAEARRGRVAAEHRVRPVNAGVYDGDVDALPFDAARQERVAHVNLRRVAVELRRAHVVNGVVEEHGDGRVRVHGLHPAHLLDDGDGGAGNRERDAVVDVVEAELNVGDLAVRPVRRVHAVNARLHALRGEAAQEVVLLGDDLLAVRVHVEVLPGRLGARLGDDDGDARELSDDRPARNLPA